MSKTKVFLSWSGDASCAAAKSWKEWLPLVLNSAEPWLSAADIDKGIRWENEISKQLENSSVGILFVTPQNLKSEWLHFEAGALSKKQSSAYVCTYLIGLSKNELPQPLSMFQATDATESDTLKLIKTINSKLGSQGLSEVQCEESFKIRWFNLESKLMEIRYSMGFDNLSLSLDEKVTEILELLRAEKLSKDELTSEAQGSRKRTGNFYRDLVRLFAVSMDLGWKPTDPKILHDLAEMIIELRRGHTESAFYISARLRELRAKPDFVRTPDPVQDLDRAYCHDPENIP